MSYWVVSFIFRAYTKFKDLWIRLAALTHHDPSIQFLRNHSGWAGISEHPELAEGPEW